MAGGYFADVTTGGTASQVTAVDVTLPAAADNQAQVEVRIMTTNAPGVDEWVGIDDINVSSAVFSGGTDITPPSLVSSTPTDNATGVAVSADIVLSFDEAVKAGVGDITVTDGAGDVRVITMGASDPDGTVTFNGATVTLNLTNDLAANRAYDVLVAPGAIEDSAGNDFTGIALDALDFTTAAARRRAHTHLQHPGRAGSRPGGQTVTTKGVVTAIAGNGFLHPGCAGDGNAATSTASSCHRQRARRDPGPLAAGHRLGVGVHPGRCSLGSLSITELTGPRSSTSVGPAITPIQIGGSARPPPTSNSVTASILPRPSSMLVRSRTGGGQLDRQFRRDLHHRRHATIPPMGSTPTA